MEASTHQYPTLSLIDRAIGLPPTRFAGDPVASRLEPRARALIEEYWSDTFWLTGLVSEAAVCFVRDTLERERRALNQAVSPASVIDPLVKALSPDDRIIVGQMLDRVA